MAPSWMRRVLLPEGCDNGAGNAARCHGAISLSYREWLAWSQRSSRHRLQPRAKTPETLGNCDVRAAKERRNNRRKRVGRVPVEVAERSVVEPCSPRVRVAGSVLDVAQHLLQQPLASPSKLLQVGA